MDGVEEKDSDVVTVDGMTMTRAEYGTYFNARYGRPDEENYYPSTLREVASVAVFLGGAIVLVAAEELQSRITGLLRK